MAQRHIAYRVLVLGFALAGLTVVSSPALATCEGISNAFAYNECLSRQAPARGQRAPRITSGDPEASVINRRGRGQRRSLFGNDAGSISGVELSRRNGRTSAVIDPWGGVRSSPGQKRRR
jgi:hypothetical protein